MSLNTCTISGHLGDTADLRYTNGGLAIVTFSVAVNERRRQDDGSYADVTNWLDCTMFGKRAEALQPYLAKGTKVAVIGHLHQSDYERNGQRRRRIEIIVDEVDLMNARREKQTIQPPAAEQAASVYDDEIPF